MKFHHIGIATNNIERTKEKLQKFFNVKEISNTIYDKNQDAYLCMITLDDNIKIELINGKVVENILKKRQYLYHTCYETDDLENEMKKLIDDGAFLVSDAKEAILFDNQKVAFLMWDLGLIELLQKDIPGGVIYKIFYKLSTNLVGVVA